MIKIIDALTCLMEELNAKSTIEEAHNKMKKNKNFDLLSISAAMSILMERMIEKPNNSENYEEINLRILAVDELSTLGMDNFNYMLKLYNLQLITTEEFNAIIEQLILYPQEFISKSIIDAYILSVLSKKDYNVPYGSRYLLNHSDVIN